MTLLEKQQNTIKGWICVSGGRELYTLKAQDSEFKSQHCEKTQSLFKPLEN
jgi:hypothetical protein